MPNQYVTTRVVLHKDDERTKEHSPDAEEYKKLHAEMHAAGYRRFYTGNGGQMFKLPPGEYHIIIEADSGPAARDVAFEKAKSAATKATSAKRFTLLVSAPNALTSANSEIITKDPDA